MTMPSPKQELKRGDIVRYVHDSRYSVFAKHDGSVGIVLSGKTKTTTTEYFYPISWVVWCGGPMIKGRLPKPGETFGATLLEKFGECGLNEGDDHASEE
jgi:hypothetical protein